MQKIQLLVTNHNKNIELTVEKMSVYLQSRILEAIDQQGHIYYLFFQQEDYLTYVKPKHIKRGSFIEKALTEGLIVHSPHPFVQSQLASNHTYKKRTFNQLVKKIQTQYSPQEASLIATYFESFVPKTTIFAFIQNIFYELRRSGKMFSCYRILQVLLTFCPRQKWVREMSNDLSFIKYSKLYHQLSSELLDKDPIFMEHELHARMNNEHYFSVLVKILQKQGRWFDLVSIYLQDIIENSIVEHEKYSTFIQLIGKYFDSSKVIDILEDISYRNKDIPFVLQDLLNVYLHNRQPENIINLMNRFDLILTSSQATKFEKIIEEINTDEIKLPTSKMISYLIPLYKINPNKADELLYQSIILLLKDYDILTVKQYLSPLQRVEKARPIIEEIDSIQMLSNDPDQQLQLGKLYYRFKQYDRAIDCFSWEMELNCHDPKPVQWLSKIYNELGMESEHTAYKQLFINMQKQA